MQNISFIFLLILCYLITPSNCECGEGRICYNADVVDEVTSVTIQNPDDSAETYFDVFFTATAGNCVNPAISFEFELIDYDSSSEYLEVYDNDDTLISTCQGGQSHACGENSECLTSHSLNTDIIAEGETYRVSIVESKNVDDFCTAIHPYSINANLTLECVIAPVVEENLFRVGIQFCEKKIGVGKKNEKCSSSSKGTMRYTPYGDGSSVWAGNKKYNNPDGMRVGVYNQKSGEEIFIRDTDIRVCIQLTDGAKNSGGNSKKTGSTKCTPWASQNGGWSSWAGDKNWLLFDAARIELDTKDSPGLIITDVKLGFQMTDNKNKASKHGSKKYTGWLGTKSSAVTDWAGDSNFRSPDAIRIYVGFQKTTSVSANMEEYYQVMPNELVPTTPFTQESFFTALTALIGVIFGVVLTLNLVMCYINCCKVNGGGKGYYGN